MTNTMFEKNKANAMNPSNNLTLTTSPQIQPARKLRGFASLALRRRSIYRRKLHCYDGKELDNETGLYYYGARYLDPKTSRWLSGDPALGEYVPSAPVNEEAKKRNGSLPGMGGVFNYANLHVYHYAGNNPVKYVDPDGRWLGHIHTAILKKTFKNEIQTGEISTSQLEQMIKASKDVDTKQGAEDSFRHSMRDGAIVPEQSVEEAKEKRKEFINEKIKAFVDSDGQDFYALGEALHPVTDEDSPLHGWSTWSGMSTLATKLKGAWHGIKEFFYGLFSTSAKDMSVEKARAVYEDAMKQLEQKREAESQ